MLRLLACSVWARPGGSGAEGAAAEGGQSTEKISLSCFRCTRLLGWGMVFCKDCRNLLLPATQLGEPRCRVAVVSYDPLAGEVLSPSDPRELNADFDCPHFTPMGAERIRPGHAAPSRSWWRFW